MADFAFRLSTLVVRDSRVVADNTGIDGHYDFAPLPDNDAFSMFTALREQVGLKLEPRKLPIEVLNVERAERPAEN